MVTPDTPPMTIAGGSALAPLLVGVVTIVCTVGLHATAGAGAIRLVQREVRHGFAGTRFRNNVIVISGAVLVALVAHLIQMAAWALVFILCGEFHALAAAFYQSAMNYTTLGYGDVVMSRHWQLLGPIEAADGMLMFGVSTAILFAVIQRLIHVKLEGIRP
jgi:hypothetical protein